MLKDLVLPGKAKKGVMKTGVGILDNDIKNIKNIDTDIACELVGVIYDHVLRSISQDRSSIKLNMFQKGMIGGVLNGTRDGTVEYIKGMQDYDINLLLNEFEMKMARRKRKR